MVISFPILVSQTVDKDILPYLLKAVERKFAVDYMPVLEEIVKNELVEQAGNMEQHLEGIIITGEHKNISKQIMLENDGNFGIQVRMSEMNKLNTDQPYFITIIVTTPSRVTQEFVFGFKAISLVADNALQIFEEELHKSSYYFHRVARKLFTSKFIWTMHKWYNKVFYNEYTKTRTYEIKKVLFSEERERLCILSINDISKEEFETADPEETSLSSELLRYSRWSGLYMDDHLNKRIYFWDEKTPQFSSLITYDSLYKNTLGSLPEQIEKAKQKDKFLFSRKIPTDSIFQKVSK